MKKVITYGTFDLLHEGHINILKRAKALGDYLIVGVTSDDYDRYRGKLNVRQSLAERISSIRETGFADEIIIEDYEGQKVEDVKRHNIDLLTLGSDWTGNVDFLKKYCDVVYLPRTEHISSTLLRTKGKIYNLGIFCDEAYDEEGIDELKFVSGIDVNCMYSMKNDATSICKKRSILDFSHDKESFIKHCDIAYVDAYGCNSFFFIKKLLLSGKHVLAPHSCGISADDMTDLLQLAQGNGVHLMMASPLLNLTAYEKLINIVLSGGIGTLFGLELSMSIPTVSNSAKQLVQQLLPTCLLPVIQLLGWNIDRYKLRFYGNEQSGLLGICNLQIAGAYAQLKFSRDIHTENRCIIVGDKAYIKVPAPWWMIDYFEMRSGNGKIKKFSWTLNGKAIRYQLADFIKELYEETYDVAPMLRTIRLTQTAEQLYSDD